MFLLLGHNLLYNFLFSLTDVENVLIINLVSLFFRSAPGRPPEVSHTVSGTIWVSQSVEKLLLPSLLHLVCIFRPAV